MKKLDAFIAIIFFLISSNCYGFFEYKNNEFEKEIKNRYSNSKILYTVSKRQNKKIILSDFNGKNVRYLISGKDFIVAPIFSKTNNEEIFYLKYVAGIPQIQKLNIILGNEETIRSVDDVIFTSDFDLNDQDVLLFSGLKYNVLNIYTLNLFSTKLIKLTYDKFQNINPSFSPDNRKITFCSNASGSQKLYVMNNNGRNIERLSYGRGECLKPLWSPNGKLIAFIKLRNKRSEISIINPNGKKERIIVSADVINDIKWSSDGEYLMYSKQERFLGFTKSYIYIINVTTKQEYKIKTFYGGIIKNLDWINI
jgi:TolB protein